MKRFLASAAVCVLVSGLACLTAAADETKKPSSESTARIGTFDSRLVATAYVRSEMFERRLEKMKAELEKAKASGNEKRVKQLQAAGPALQDLVHRQGFSTWPVHNILKVIKPKIPGIAQQAGVDMIVCKWDLVYQRQGVETVDVTDLLVAPFKPSEDTRKVLEELRAQDPVPLSELKRYK